jgi:hypothetical protein
MMKMTLERVGLRVDTFNDPVLALKSYKPHTYDLVSRCYNARGGRLGALHNKRRDTSNICFLTASSEPYREELLKEKYNQLSRDLFLEMPLPTSEIIHEVKKRF